MIWETSIGCSTNWCIHWLILILVLEIEFATLMYQDNALSYLSKDVLFLTTTLQTSYCSFYTLANWHWHLANVLSPWPIILIFLKKILFIHLLERWGGRETPMCGCLLCVPSWGPSPQPRPVPRLGIEPATLWFAGWHSIHWATPARANYLDFNFFHFDMEAFHSCINFRRGIRKQR